MAKLGLWVVGVIETIPENFKFLTYGIGCIMTFREFEGKKCCYRNNRGPSSFAARSPKYANGLPVVNKHKIDTTSSFVAHLVYIF